MEVSPERLEANRRNAQLSTGPKTRAGKAAVSRNGITHGLCARHLVVAREDRRAFEHFHQRLSDELQPATVLQSALVERVVAAAWRLRRVYRIETEIFNQKCAPFTPGLGKTFIRDSNNANSFTKLSRYETAIERGLYRALHRTGAREGRPRRPRSAAAGRGGR